METEGDSVSIFFRSYFQLSIAIPHYAAFAFPPLLHCGIFISIWTRVSVIYLNIDIIILTLILQIAQIHQPL